MALERLSLTAGAGAGDEDLNNKAPRLPRWTRQELLVLIQGKRVAENRVRRGRTAVLAFGSSAQVEPKWSSVSSYCKRHGVNRGPVQCRKRWSNLAGDFKKIKEWESGIKEEAESFWVMRNDLRRERKLPGFFDREVYDILDGGGGGGGDKSLVLSLATRLPDRNEEDEEEEEEVVFDSGRTAAADDGLFSPSEEASPHEPAAVPAPITAAAAQYESFSQGIPASAPATAPTPDPAPFQAAADKESSPGPEGRKRKREEDEEEMSSSSSLQKQLIEAMERNGRLLSSQLEIQNTNSHLDREQRKDYANGLFSVLNKLADAMGRIADKL